MADLDEELTFDSIRAGRGWTGVDGLSPTLPESTCDFLECGDIPSLYCATEANLPGAHTSVRIRPTLTRVTLTRHVSPRSVV